MTFTLPSPSFCVLPWVHAATLTDGSVQLCCVADGASPINLNDSTLGDYWNSSYLRGIRRSMLEGKPVKECWKCHQEESNSYRSHRVVENGVWERKLTPETLVELIGSTEADGYLQAGVQSVDLRLGNTCNLQCVMCQPRDSSKWLGLAKKLSEGFSNPDLRSEYEYKSLIDTSLFEWYRNDAFWEDLTEFLGDLKEIIIAGGEPMLIKEHFAFIRAVCESGHAEHIHLRYHTNGTIFPEEMVAYWGQFKVVEFFISLDGIGEIAEYVRYPSKWAEIEANIRRFDQLGDNVILKLLFSAHALNTYYLPEFLTWARTAGLSKMTKFSQIQQFVHPGIVHWPLNQNLKVLPLELKRVITDRIEAHLSQYSAESVTKYTAILQHMNSEDQSERFPQLIEYTRGLDAARGTDLSKTFPELVEYWA